MRTADGQQVHLRTARAGSLRFQQLHLPETASRGRGTSSWKPAPWNTLIRAAPRASRRARPFERQLRQVHGARLRRWRRCRSGLGPCPTAAHPRRGSGSRPRAARTPPASRKSPCTNSTPASCSIGRMSLATTRPARPPAAARTGSRRPGRRPDRAPPCPGLQQPLALVDLLELEHRPRAPALGLGPLHEGIGEMLAQPAVAALGAAAS